MNPSPVVSSSSGHLLVVGQGPGVDNRLGARAPAGRASRRRQRCSRGQADADPGPREAAPSLHPADCLPCPPQGQGHKLQAKCSQRHRRLPAPVPGLLRPGPTVSERWLRPLTGKQRGGRHKLQLMVLCGHSSPGPTSPGPSQTPPHTPGPRSVRTRVATVSVPLASTWAQESRPRL